MTNPMTETGEKGMTHEAGIEAACQAYLGASFDNLSEEGFSAAIQAYLSASGMVLVPREPTEEMLKHCDVSSLHKADIEEIYLTLLEAAPDPFKSQP